MPSALVIEGNRSLSERLCQLLALLDITPRPAYTLQAAMLTLTEAVPDLIFLSLQSFVTDGIDMLGFFQSEIQLADVPVIVAVEPQESLPEQILQAGVFEVIPHPPNLEAVERVLRKAGFV